MKPTAHLLFGAAAVVSLLGACRSYEAPPYDGRNLYLGYCAACHGPGGAGDGPAASSLNVAVPDLRLLKGADGHYPRDLVEEVIDGRTMRAAHGSQDMPVWGWTFRHDEGDTPEGRANVRARIEALNDYIRTLQR